MLQTRKWFNRFDHFSSQLFLSRFQKLENNLLVK